MPRVNRLNSGMVVVPYAKSRGRQLDLGACQNRVVWLCALIVCGTTTWDLSP
jgi:hypothetical protein